MQKPVHMASAHAVGRADELISPKAPRTAQRLIDEVFDALDDQTIAVPGTDTLGVMTPWPGLGEGTSQLSTRPLPLTSSTALPSCNSLVHVNEIPDECSGTQARGATMPTKPADATASSVADLTRHIVQEFLAARMAGDVERLVALFADDVDWLLAENPAVPWIRPRSTGAECAAQSTELAEHTVAQDARASVDTFLVDGTNAVLMGHLSGTVRATGKSFDGPFALRLTVEGGRITRHHLYENSLSIAEACTSG